MPINLQTKSSGPNESGFVIVRLNKPIVTHRDNLRELSKQHSYSGLERLLADHPQVGTRRTVRSVPAKTILELERRAAASSFPPLHSLCSYWRLDCRTLEDSGAIVKALNSLREIDLAYREMAVSDPVVNAADDAYAANQNYLDTAPVGIDARWAWAQANGEGAGVGFVDLEQGWFLNHEDLPAPGLLSNDNRDGVGGYDGDHGTAVLGQVCGVDNTLGIVGIAPSLSTVNVTSHYEAATDTNGHVADAILAAIPTTAHGDILLLEVERGADPLPTETDPNDLDAIRLAAAQGIIVVEAAGNGDNDLDAWIDPLNQNRLNRGSPQFVDSGATMVGAADSALDAAGTGHDRSWFSNFGSRVDCYGWGDSIVTAGYGDLDPGTGNDSSYTDTFGGTSGASPMVVGAGLVIQGMYEAATGTRLSPGQMRSLLSDPATGTPQGLGRAGNIGSMPDLRRVIPQLGIIPDIYIRDAVGDTGAIPSVGGISASPDVIVRPTAVANPTNSFGAGSGTENSNTLGFEVTPGQDNVIYVRMQNRGNSAANGVRATVYWSEVATLVTPDMWNPIGTTVPVDVPVGDTLVVTDALVWSAADIPGPGHYCFVAVADHLQDQAPPLPFGADWDGFKAFIRTQNNVAWRNFNVVDVAPDPSAPAQKLDFFVAGAPDRPRRFDFEIQRKLPEDVEVWLEIPMHLIGATPPRNFPKVKFDRKKNTASLLLPNIRSIRLSDVPLTRSAREKSRFLIKGSRQIKIGWHYLAISQIHEGDEVGRVTWAIDPRGKKRREAEHEKQCR